MLRSHLGSPQLGITLIGWTLSGLVGSFFGWMAPLSVSAQTTDSNLSHDEVHQVFAELFSEFQSAGVDPSLINSRESEWGWPRDPSRLLIVPPPSSNDTSTIDPAEMEPRKAAAEKLFAIASEWSQADREGDAYRLLFQVLALDPEHAATRTVLGSTLRALDDETDSAKVTTQTRTEPTYGWGGGEWRRIDSAHFTVIGSADAAALEQVNLRLERLYVIWDATFFDVWSPTGRLTKAIREGKALSRSNGRKHTVVLFATRDEYLDRLQGLAPNVESSKGYYAPTRRQSMFFTDDSERPVSLWHEVTHQLFHERLGARSIAGEKSNFWLVEGIAALMESVEDHGSYLTVGGYDAERLQYARFNLFSAKALIPFEQMTELGQDAFQSDPQVRSLYSQGAGICSWLLTHPQPSHRRALMKLLDLVYAGRDQADSLSQLLELSFDDCVRDYVEFLRPRKAMLFQFPPAAYIDCLALPYGDVDDETLLSLPELAQLTWIDLTEAPISNRSLSVLQKFARLEQLFLEGTAVNDAGLGVIAECRTLKELDLSGTTVTAAGLTQLSALPQLEALVLNDVKLDRGALEAIEQISSLRQVELKGSGIAATEVESLQRRLSARGN